MAPNIRRRGMEMKGQKYLCSELEKLQSYFVKLEQEKDHETCVRIKERIEMLEWVLSEPDTRFGEEK